MKELSSGVVIDASIRGGKPIIRDTRVPVDLVIDKLSTGMTYHELMTEYDLTEKQILDALKYAAVIISNEEIRVVSQP